MRSERACGHIVESEANGADGLECYEHISHFESAKSRRTVTQGDSPIEGGEGFAKTMEQWCLAPGGHVASMKAFCVGMV